MKNMSLSSPFKAIARGFARFHMTLFIVLIVAGLGSAVLFVNEILSDPTGDDSYVSPIGAGSIDQTTLERIKELHTSDEKVTAPTLPEGRANPFGE